MRRDLFEQRIANRLVDDQTAAGIADLSGIGENTGSDARRSRIQIVAIGKHHLRRLASQFQADALDVGLARILHEIFANLG